MWIYNLEETLPFFGYFLSPSSRVLGDSWSSKVLLEMKVLDTLLGISCINRLKRNAKFSEQGSMLLKLFSR